MRLAALALAGGCTVVVHVDSRPVPAEVALLPGQMVRLPAEIPLRWVPFRRPQLLCTAIGYRSVTVPVRLGLGSLHRARAVEVVLIPEHGPTGTWTEGDIP